VKVECCWVFQNFVNIIPAYVFPNDRYEIPVFPLLSPLTVTLSLKMKIFYLKKKQFKILRWFLSTAKSKGRQLTRTISRWSRVLYVYRSNLKRYTDDEEVQKKNIFT